MQGSVRPVPVLCSGVCFVIWMLPVIYVMPYKCTVRSCMQVTLSTRQTLSLCVYHISDSFTGKSSSHTHALRHISGVVPSFFYGSTESTL